VGSGIVISFSEMNAITGQEAGMVRVQPGAIYEQVNKKLRENGLRLTYDPSSRRFCTVGGNVGTKASGLRSIKYGSVDSALRSLRFLDTKHGLVDTSQQLPEDFELEITRLKNKLRSDMETKRFLDGRANLKSSSGYNLKSLYEHEEPAEIVTHLLAGSVGTLGIFGEIELETAPAPTESVMFLLFFPSVVAAAKYAAPLKSLEPSTIELVDRYGLSIVEDKNIAEVPAGSEAVLIVEIDSEIDKARTQMQQLLKERSVPFTEVQDKKRQAAVWEIRETMLLRIINTLETSDEKFPSFADDIAVPPEHLPDFITAIQSTLRKFGTHAVFFGHAGEGNIHVRPLIRRENWKNSIRDLSEQFFRTTLSFGGTITSEHGNGRNRSSYLRLEWGDKIYSYFEEIKQLFDPMGLLNPGVVFTSDEVTKNLNL
jgi:FAD/FMN-containing dehydrogenase